MFDPQTMEIAVAFLNSGEGKVAVSWNDKWESFVLPMTKLDGQPPTETAEEAAVRAAAEVMQLPVRVVPGKSEKKTRKLQMSNRDGEIKNYQFTVVPIEVHPDFQSAMTHRPVLMPTVEKLLSGEFQPLSPTVKPILETCTEWGWIE